MRIQHSKPTLSEKEVKAVSNVIASGYIAEGECTRTFEKKAAKYVGVDYASATNNGSSALHLALLALGIGEGDEVIIPTYTCPSVLHTVNNVKATPILCDVNLTDFNISLEDIEKKITEKTAGIIVPHMFGLPADIKKIKKFSIKIIEDCAQSFGATIGKKRVGNFGDIAITSFYATKMMTTGQGGMTFTKSKKLQDRIEVLKDYDMKRYPHQGKYKTRFNYAMTDIQAAMGRVQLDRLDGFIKKRKKIAGEYSKSLLNQGFQLPTDIGDRKHTYYRYIIRAEKDNNHIIKALRERGIESYPGGSHILHRYLGLDKKDFDSAEILKKRSISVPIFPTLSKLELEYIVNTLKSTIRY